MTKSKDSNSPNLEVISNESSSRSLERRNLPRLSLTSEQFRLSQNNRIFSVTDVSEKGMGLWIIDSDDLRSFQVGMLIEGVLNLKREKHPTQARVRNLTRDRIGCEFENMSSTLKTALSELLDPAVLGSELKPIPSSGMNVLWYHGPSGTDLLLRRLPDGQFERLTLYVFGTFVQWDSEQGLVTGRTHSSTHDRSEIRGILRLETLLLEQDNSPDSSKLGIAKTIILSSNLPKDLKNWCLRHFER